MYKIYKCIYNLIFRRKEQKQTTIQQSMSTTAFVSSVDSCCPSWFILICYILAAVGIRRTRLSGKSRPLRILAVLVCAFFLCWAPYHFLGLVKLVNKDNEAVKAGWAMASHLAYFNSCINPVLYFCMGLDVRRRCNQSLSGIFHRALMEEGQSLSQQGTREESCNSIAKTADIECKSTV